MDSLYNAKPYENGWFEGTTIFGNIHIKIFLQSVNINDNAKMK